MAGHTQRQWEGKFFRCGMRCFYCYKPLTLAEATKDHLTPQAREGSDFIDNIVPACLPCNQRKGAMTEPEFRTAFSEAFKTLTGVVSSSCQTSLCTIDGPTWEKVRDEVFSRSASWAWRHPA